MKKSGKILLTVAGVGTLIGFMYRGPISDLARGFMSEVKYMYSINSETAFNLKSLEVDDSLSSRIISDVSGSNEGIWNMDTAPREVFDEFMTQFPFIREVGDWVIENVLSGSVGTEEGESVGSSGTDESVTLGNNES